MEKAQNPPAFPCPASEIVVGNTRNIQTGQAGMTLRDYFAGQTITRDGASVKWAYEIADTILKQREQ